MKRAAGERLDALVAEKILGARWVRFHDARYKDPDTPDQRVHASLVLPKDFSFFGLGKDRARYVYDTGECPRDRYSWIKRYSTEIAAAWEVVSGLNRLGYTVSLNQQNDLTWTCQLFKNDRESGEASGKTGQLAICRAALKIKETHGQST